MFGFLRKNPKPASNKSSPPTLWRQGDVFIIALSSLPGAAKEERRRPVLAEGELTGHAHRIQDPSSAQVLGIGDALYLEVLADSATIVHEEHLPIILPRGAYEVRIQREYSPQEIRRVID